MKLTEFTVQHQDEGGYVNTNKVNESMSIILLLVARRVSLVVAFSFLAFPPKFWEVVGTYEC